MVPVQHTRDLPMLYWVTTGAARREKIWPWEKGREAALFFVVRGRMRFLVQEQLLEPSAGELMVLPALLPHCVQTFKGTRDIMLSFIPAGFDFDNSARIISFGQNSIVQRWMQDFVMLWQQQYLEREVTGLLLVTLLTYIKRYEEQQDMAKVLHPCVSQSIKVMRQDLAASVTIEDLAKSAHVSVSHLQTLFRQQFGCSPLKYRQELRMQQAAHLLEKTDLSLSEVAYRCGYADAEYFGRLFRRTYRQPPSAWRSSKIGRRSRFATRERK
jgi:AraC-like DNA-binding protein